MNAPLQRSQPALKLAALTLLGAMLATSSADAATKLRIIYSAVSGYAASYVAKDQEFFAKRELDVEFVPAAHGGAIIAGVVSGSVEVGTPTPTVFLQAIDGGLDQVALAATNVFPERTNSGVIARTSSNIKSAQDLIGKRVGVPGINGLLDVVLRRWLTAQGVDTRRVTFVEVSFPQMSNALRAGNVDAVVVVDPFYSRILEQKTGYLLDNYTKGLPDGTIASVYSATSRWAAANSPAVEAFQEALVEAVAFSKSDPEATRESIAKYTRLPPAVVATLPIPNLTARIQPSDLRFWIDVMKERGMLTGSPDPAKLVVPWTAD
jgi:NitT/TauT family transport system substrate-binding protein